MRNSLRLEEVHIAKHFSSKAREHSQETAGISNGKHEPVATDEGIAAASGDQSLAVGPGRPVVLLDQYQTPQQY